MFNLKFLQKIFKKGGEKEMKKTIILLLILALASFSVVPVSWAAAVSGATNAGVTASATVPTLTPEFGYQIFKLDRALVGTESVFDIGTDVTELRRFDFGTLIHTAEDTPGVITETGYLYSKTYFCVVMWATGYGRKYQLRSSCSSTNVALTKGFVLTPFHATGDKFDPSPTAPTQGTQPPGSLLGNGDGKGMSAVGTNLNIYTSQSPSTPRIIQAYYSIPRPPAPPKTGDDIYTGWEGLHLAPLPDGRPAVIPPAGTVSAAVTITIAAI